MRWSNNPGQHLIDITIVLSGIILLLVAGYLTSSMLSNILQAVGTGLIAAGFVSYLIRTVHSSEKKQAGIKIISDNRMILEQEYIRRKLSAQKIDVLGVALSGALKEIATDTNERILNRILFDRVKVRLMFLCPTASFVDQRAIEDGVNPIELQNILKQSIIHCSTIYERLQKLYKSTVESGRRLRDRTGSIEIRIIDICPYFAMIRTDEDILWGIYTSAARGLDSAVLQVTRKEDILFSQLTRHFDKLWHKSEIQGIGSNCIMRYHDPEIPVLNEQLLTNLLGPNWKSECK